ncbi:LysR family transcriptional regulator [Amorphus sp. 3PC139-8]
MRTTISQLRVLEAVARTGSFSGAARELGITQPSVSTQLRAVEGQCKLKLIARDGHKIRVTRFGDTVLPKVRALLTIMNEIEDLLEDERSLKTGALRLGYSTDQFAMPVISRYMGAYPGIKLETRCMASLDVVSHLKKGEFDAAFITAKEPPDGLTVERLRTDRIVLMVPADHPFAARGQIGWGELARCAIVCRETTSGTRIIFETAAKDSAVPLQPLIALGSWQSMRAGVLAGMGVGVALAGELDESDRIKPVEIDDPGLWASHYLACLPEMREATAVDRFFDVASGFRDDVMTDRKT